MYQIFDGVQYGHMEPMVPFSKIYESEELDKIIQHLNELNAEKIYFVTKDNKVLFDTSSVIFESPDGGKTIYKRKILDFKNKEQI